MMIYLLKTYILPYSYHSNSLKKKRKRNVEMFILLKFETSKQRIAYK